MKKIVCAIFFIIISSNVFCWEIANELNVHEPLNNAMFESFTGNFSNSPKYENTSIDKETKFEGISWHKGSQISVENKNTGFRRNETFAEWIKIGGIDADIDSTSSEKITVEEGNFKKTYTFEKALRHFYDPKVIPRYLTDYSSWAKNQGIPDPKMDHLTWAMSEKSHHWSFNQGLTLYKAALENVSKNNLPSNISNFDGYFHPDGDFRGNLFSAAFRALGETLHCAGDLCMPAHVRDDAHGGEDLAGGIDPIELSIGYSQAIEILRNKKGTPSPADLSKSSVKEILEYCANFTNENFFSKDSICNVEPQIAPRSNANKNYPFPSFLKSEISRSSDQTQQLKRSIAGEEVILAEESLVGEMRDPIFGKIVREGNLQWLVPKTAAEGQASVLLPLAAAAGGEIIDRFLPTMKLSLEISKDQNNSTVLNGSLVHEIDKDIEWKSIGAIKYCGEGEIKVNSSTVATATFVDGIMAPVTGMSFKEKDKVQLFVMAGALIHQSNVITISTTVDTPVPTWVYAKGPEFTQLYVPSKKKTADGLDGVGVGYFETPLPATMATVLVNNFVRYDWWCDDASGTGMSNYWGGSFPEKDTIPELEVIHDYWFFSQNYASSPKELLTWTYSRELKKFCAPGGAHVLHLRAYYGPNDDSLFGKPDLQHYISLDLPFEVKAASSPITVYEYKGKDNGGYIPSEIISFSSTYPDPDSQFTGPTWAPSTWKRLKFDFDGPYTYYYKYPDLKAVGFYKKGLRSGHWTARNATNSFEIDYGSEENIIGLKIYGKDGSLEKRYSLSDTANQSSGISFSVRFMEVRGSLKNGHVETFVDPKEDYYLINSQKDGPYTYYYKYPDLKAVGSYNKGLRSGHWTAQNATNSFEIDYGSEENIIELKIYGKDGSLERRYTSSDTANQSSGISFSVQVMEPRGSLKNGHVETFIYPKEDYYLINSQKDGPYSFIDSNGTTIKGQYSNGNPSGIWMYHDPAKDPADWTRSY